MATIEALTKGNGTLTAQNLNSAIKSYLGKETNFTGDGPWQYQGEEGAYAITSDGNVSKGWITINDENGAPVQVTNGKMTLNVGDYINYDPGTEATYTSEVGIDQTKTTPYKTYGPNWTGGEQEFTNYKASDYQKLLEADENKDIKNKGNGYEEQTYFAADAKNGDLKWKVLGADGETGELLIVAADVLKKADNTTKEFTLKEITGYLHGVDELNNICNVYGQGKGATGGRSVTYDDIDKAIGKTKTTVNEKWKYSWTTDSLSKKSPYYLCAKENGYFYFSHLEKDTTNGIFNYYNEETKKWETNEKDLSKTTETEEFATITRNDIEYNINGKNYETSLKERYVNTKGYSVLFKTGDGKEIEESTSENNQKNSYWLSSSYCNSYSDYAYWGLYYVYTSGCVRGCSFYFSMGTVGTWSCGVRPIVSLQSNIKLQENSISNNTYDIID